MLFVNAANATELDGYLWSAFQNNQDYEITLTGLVYTLSSTRAQNPTIYNPSPAFPYGETSTQRSNLPQIKTTIIIKAQVGTFATLTRDMAVSPSYRHFYVQIGGSLTLERLDIEYGDVGTVDTGGGAILNQGALIVRHCKLGPNNKSNYGGAILNLEGTTTLENCDIFDNEADWGGALYNGFANASMTITNSRIAGNKSIESWGVGGGIANMSGILTVNCCIIDNQANLGGGIAAYGSGGATVEKSIVRKNSAASGSQLYVRDGGTIDVKLFITDKQSATHRFIGMAAQHGRYQPYQLLAA